ncbi:hypothetical protein [Emticicia sp. 17c]|uniref:hypothetical protein n=1 Tax=Emticicia sp. 17c TaxID=3127704 RepID=UPI00301D7024
MIKSRPQLNGYGDSEGLPIIIFNEIGQRYNKATAAEKELFFQIAQAKALQLGSEQNNFAQMFRQHHSKCPIANVRTYFLHAAHEVWGMDFDLTVKARSKTGKTFYCEVDGNQVAITVEPV